MSSASYRLVGADGAVLGAGSGEVTVTARVLEFQPADGATLRVPPGRIASVSEPEPFVVRVTLADGTALELGKLGRMRTQLLAELRDAQAEAAATESGALGDAVRFSAAVGGSPVDLYLFEDALLVFAGGLAKRIAFSFVADVRARDYTVTVDVKGQDPLDVSRLGRRTDEFTALLAERLRQARNRTAAFLASLVPGLDPMALRAAAGLLRDGVAVQVGALDAIHPDLSATLLRVATLPDRFASVSGLMDKADVSFGVKQLTSVRRAAVGVTPWVDHAATPHIGQHETPGGRFGPGVGGMLTAGVMSGIGPGGGLGSYGPGGYAGYAGPGYGGPFGGGPFGGGPFGEFGGYWAFRALGVNLGGAGAGPPTARRAEARNGLLIPETQDLAALTTSGAAPTVLAFALLTPARGGDPVAYETLNLPEPVTYVYRAGGPDPRALVNQALDDAGFAAADIRALVTTVPHGPAWSATLADLLAD